VAKRNQEKRKTTQAVKTTPHIVKDKEPLWYRVRKTPPKRKRKTNYRDQEGCRLDMRPASDESW
jgi:hypothetical protein